MPDIQDAYLILLEKYEELKSDWDEVCGIVLSQQLSKTPIPVAYDEVSAVVVRNLQLYRGTEQSG